MENINLRLQKMIDDIISKVPGFIIEDENGKAVLTLVNKPLLSMIPLINLRILLENPDDYKKFDGLINERGINGKVKFAREDNGKINQFEISFKKDEDSIQYVKFEYNGCKREKFKFSNKDCYVQIFQEDGKIVNIRYGNDKKYRSTNIISQEQIADNFGSPQNCIITKVVLYEEDMKDKQYLGNTIEMQENELKRVCVLFRIKKGLVFEVVELNKNEMELGQEDLEKRKKEYQTKKRVYEIEKSYEGTQVVKLNGQILEEETPQYQEFLDLYEKNVQVFEGVKSQTQYTIVGRKNPKKNEAPEFR